MAKTKTQDAFQLNMTLEEMSVWVHQKVGGVGRDGVLVDLPKGELLAAIRSEALAKEAVKPLAADKETAVQWTAARARLTEDKKIEVAEGVLCAIQPGREVPASVKVDSAAFKRRYPADYERARRWTPFRQVVLGQRYAVPPARPLPDALPPLPEVLPENPAVWTVSAERAYEVYVDRSAGIAVHQQVIDDAKEAVSRLLTHPEIIAAYSGRWDGHGKLAFTCGTTIQLDRKQFSQEAALEVIEAAEAEGRAIVGVFEVVPAHTTAGSRTFIKAHAGAAMGVLAGADRNPFEGD